MEQQGHELAMHEWEEVCDKDGGRVWRFRVPGGWLYQVIEERPHPPSAPVFVAEVAS